MKTDFESVRKYVGRSDAVSCFLEEPISDGKKRTDASLCSEEFDHRPTSVRRILHEKMTLSGSPMSVRSIK